MPRVITTGVHRCLVSLLQVFYWTHSMFVVFWILLILHGPIFWMFFIAPATAYLLERIYRTRLFKLAKYGSIHIMEMNLLPSKVSRLRSCGRVAYVRADVSLTFMRTCRLRSCGRVAYVHADVSLTFMRTCRLRSCGRC